MIVVDASAALDWLLQTSRSETIRRRIVVRAEQVHVPHLFDIEVAQTLRRLVRLEQIDAPRAQQCLEDAADLPATRHGHSILLPRIWSLRAALTAYDAAYVALAEALDAPLLTCDEKLARSHGHHAAIEVVR